MFYIFICIRVFMYICIFAYILCSYYIYYVPFSLKMPKNIKSTTRHLKFSYISIFTNLLWTDNEMKSVKTIYNYVN